MEGLTVVINGLGTLLEVSQTFHGGHDGVQRSGDTIATLLPLQIEHCNERLRDGGGPAIPELHSILLGDHHMVGTARRMRQLGHVFVAVIVMILPGGHLYRCSSRLGLSDECVRVSDARRSNHPLPGQR